MKENPVINSVEARIAVAWPVERWRNARTIVGVSGGPDSVALLHALTRLSQSSGTPSLLVVTHVNHGTRGAAAEADAKFVKALADRLQLKFYQANLAPPATGSSESSESSLRTQRYRVFRDAATKFAARYLVTGHTQDDQIETVLFRILRGTGLRGLAGIPAFRNLSEYLTVARPMLSISRVETQAYLNAIDEDYCIDATNQDSRYTRNFLRNELLPLARSKFSDVDQAIARLSEAAKDQQNSPAKMDTDAIEAISILHEPIETLMVDCTKINQLPGSLIIDSIINTWETLGWPRGQINRATWLQVADLIQSTSGKREVINLPGNIRAQRLGAELTFTRPPG